MLFISSMCDQARASIPDGVHANAFSFAAALKISDYFKGVDNVCQINLGSQDFWRLRLRQTSFQLFITF